MRHSVVKCLFKTVATCNSYPSLRPRAHESAVGRRQGLTGVGSRICLSRAHLVVVRVVVLVVIWLAEEVVTRIKRNVYSVIRQ